MWHYLGGTASGLAAPCYYAAMRAAQRTGMIHALAGFALLAAGDAVIKTIAGQWAPTAVAATRYTLGAIGLGTLLAIREGRGGFVMPMPWVQVMRGAAVALSTATFFAALFVMPLSAITSITFTSPVITAILATVFLREPARRETWIATAAAFAGVLIVLRPNLLALGWEALLPLVSATGMSVLMIGNRIAAGSGSPLVMQFHGAVIAAPLLVLAALAGNASGAMRLAVGWPEWTVLARCALIAVSASTAHWLVYKGTTRAGAATVAPMSYAQLLVALVLGWLIFGERPDPLSLLGAAIILGAGLYLWRAGSPRHAVGRSDRG